MTKRVILIVSGALLLFVGLVLALGGGVVMAIAGSDNTVSSGTHRLSTTTTALVTRVANIEHARGVTDTLGSPTIRLSVTGSGKPIFIGIGPAVAVDRYLAGAPVEQVNNLELHPFRLETTIVPGSGRVLPPDAQTFWVARGVGTAPSLNWKLVDGSYRMVIMNADATPGVVTDGRVALRVPHLFAIGIALLAIGVVLLIVGVLLLVLGLRSRQPTRPAGPPAAPGWPSGAPPAHPSVPAHQSSSVQPPPPVVEESDRPDLRKPPQ